MFGMQEDIGTRPRLIDSRFLYKQAENGTVKSNELFYFSNKKKVIAGNEKQIWRFTTSVWVERESGGYTPRRLP